MVLAGRGDGFVLALRQRVIFPHQALQFGEFADDFGQEIGLGELRRARGELGIGLCDRRQPRRELADARDARFLRAELFVEHDAGKARQPVF